MRFDVLDVFANQRYAGNQLAVVRDAAALSDDEMLLIARETNFSETTFVLDDKPTVRIFTPKEEVPFAGHPTLGTAALLMGEAEEITLRLKIWPLRVWREDGLYWMRQRTPTFGPAHDAAMIAKVLGLTAKDIVGPVETVSTGLPHIVVQLRSVEALRRARVDAKSYGELVQTSEAKCLFPFSLGASDPTNQVTARQFAPYFGVVEDPATGSGNGCLAAYLSRHRVLGNEHVKASVEQGAQVGRPSQIHLRANKDIVEVGGRVQRIVEGRLVGRTSP